MTSTNRVYFIVCFIALLLLLSPTFVAALPFEVGGKAGFENFKWQEFNQGGQQTVEESGVRQAFSAFMRSKAEPKQLPHFIYGAEIKIYAATVDYSDNVPANANRNYETDYSGVSLEGEAGLRAGSMPFAWDFVARGGIDYWTRTMDGDLNESTRDVQAEEQDYSVFVMRLATGPAWRAGRWYGRVIAGVKFPFSGVASISSDKSRYDDDVTLDFDGKPSGFLTIANNIRINEKFSITIDGYYDTYHFKRSDTDTVYLDNGTETTVTIPESKQKNYGIQGGVSVDF